MFTYTVTKYIILIHIFKIVILNDTIRNFHED